MKILAIESSCDETAAAVITQKEGLPFVLSSVVSSQIDIHQEFGGVVPEVAARAHIENVIGVIKKALKDAKTLPEELDRIAITYGPGLVGSLVVGVETAKALSTSWQKPIFPINHLEGHIYANFIYAGSGQKPPQFPLVALLVSGGHTLLIYMKDHFSYEVVGQTIDDAAGEAFDKGAKILGLSYPGGPLISKLAKNGNPNRFDFPIIDLTPKPKRNKDGFLEQPEKSLNFSFSGLKTALLTMVKSNPIKNKQELADLAASYEHAIVESLAQNADRAVQKFKPKSFILSGGVAANELLRERLEEMLKTSDSKISYFTPSTDLCTDNAAMIGAVAFFRKEKEANSIFCPEPNLELKSSS